MRFQKNNQYGFTSKRERKLDKRPISFKGYEGQLDQLRAVPEWQERMRAFVDQLISDLPKND